MFKETLAASFKTIFGVKKVSFSAPGEAREQEVLFVEIQDVNSTFKDGAHYAKAIGTAMIRGDSDKLAYGFLAKRIEQAAAAVKRPFHFHNFESASQDSGDIIEVGLSFVYFFNSQYDPELGTLTEVEITIEEH